MLTELWALGRWLLVFDNAEDPADITRWLPLGGGHVLITARKLGWAESTSPAEVDVLARSESVAILLDRVTRLGEPHADRRAAELGTCRWLSLGPQGSWPRPEQERRSTEVLPEVAGSGHPADCRPARTR